MLGYAKEQRSLTREQKKAVGLLSIGTFLEYVDFMLYIHMGVLLNEVFFAPTYSPYSAALLGAFSFSAPFIVRPIGALIFGWIGDRIGRKSTVIITTSIMAISCLIIANLQSYTRIGITASIIVIICRILQGMSSIGEVIGVELYFTETIKPPKSYQVVGLIGIFSVLGGTAALGLVSLITSYGFNWRLAFWVGAGIAFIGMAARTTLRETPEFVNAKRRLTNIFNHVDEDPSVFLKNPIYNENISKLTSLFLLFIDCMWPLCFYVAYIYCGDILKNSFNYSTEQVIHQNFYVSIAEVGSLVILSYLSYRIHPLKILKYLNFTFFAFALICPYLIFKATTPFELLLIQITIISFGTSRMIGVPIFFKHFPVFKRYISVSVIHALSRALVYVITSFGLIYLNIDHWGLIIIMTSASIGFALGINHFEKLEKKKSENYNYDKNFVDSGQSVSLT
ncbi:MAG TPA: MFS transporter [Rickettsia endosymbiont of Columbicola hoogstraali]|nr:MFS transporter [Rickettsia endosymbiont of Columbicola hoogstraali]